MDDAPVPAAPERAPTGTLSETSGTSGTGIETPGSPSDRLARLSPAERTAWRTTGDLPAFTAPQADGDSGDADAVEDHSVPAAERGSAPAPGTPAADASAAGTPAADASAAGRTLAKRKQTAQERINELARKNYTLEGELNALRAQLAPSNGSSRPAAADQAPPPVAPSPRASSADPDEPQEENFATYKEYVRAEAAYQIQLARKADKAEREQEAQSRQFTEVASAHDAKVAAFAAAHPDFADIVRNQTDVLPTPLLADAVLHSEIPGEIAYYLNTHVEEYRALVSLPPGPMLKALGKLESRLEAGRPATAAAPSPNHISRAPAPPTTLGARPASPVDDVDAAGARGDVGAYLRAANARELAARGK